MSYICYILRSDNPKYSNRTYTGITNNSTRRLRQHNGIIKGGARASHVIRPVRYFLQIHNLTKSKALSIERTLHNMKHRKDRRYMGLLGSLLSIGWLIMNDYIDYHDIRFIG
jgi:structure-specific endonuclease subunit SLX1